MSKTQSLLLVLIASACRVGFAATFTSQSLVDRAWCEFADSQIVAAMTITSPTCKKNTIAAAQNDLDAQVAHVAQLAQDKHHAQVAAHAAHQQELQNQIDLRHLRFEENQRKEKRAHEETMQREKQEE